MNSVQIARIVFTISGIYDLFLGIVFLFFPLFAFDLFKVEHPNHLGYVQFPAAILIIFALMFFNIAKDPIDKISLMPYGIMLKAAYSGIIFWYWLLSSLPDMWKPFAIADFLFMIAFGWCYYTIRLLRATAD